MDEGIPDLDEQFNNQDTAHHRYFVNPYNVNAECWGPLFEVEGFTPIPSRIQELIGKQSVASFMGIIPEINRAWISVDNRIFFWNYTCPQEIDEYDGLSEVIVAVGLTTPVFGVFLETIRYLIVIATTIEVVILAVSWNESTDTLRIIPTQYTVSTDSVTMFKIAGTQFGRIFMAGSDGNLYELVYDLADGHWRELLGIDGQRAHKCRKINCNAWNWRTVLLPPFLRSIMGVDESLMDICIDDARHLLYCTTSRNCIRVMHLGRTIQSDSTGAGSTLLVHSFDLLSEMKSFLSRSFRRSGDLPDSAAISGIFVIPVTESRRAHVVVVLQSGVRVYLRILNNHVPLQPGDVIMDARLEIAHIRSPPPTTAVNSSRGSSNNRFPALTYASTTGVTGADTSGNGFEPATQAESSLRISQSHYAHGMFIAAIENSTGGDEPDELLGISEDLLARNLSTSRSLSGQLPNMRECVSIVTSSNGRSPVQGKVFDLKESCRFVHSLKNSTLRSLYYASRTPTLAELNNSSTSSIDRRLDRALSAIVPPAPPSQIPYTIPASDSSFLSPIGRSAFSGFQENSLKSVVPLGDLCKQAMPSAGPRRVLCLTRFGLCEFSKNRPIDFLVNFLSSVDGDFENEAFSSRVQAFYWHYGFLQASAMCLEIYCGLPETSRNDASFSLVADKGVLRERALRTLRKYCGADKMAPIANGMGGLTSSLQDNRLAITGAAAGPSSAPFSAVHDASFLVASRFLRPIWLRNILDDTKSDRLSELWSMDGSSVLCSIRTNLMNLMRFLEDYYPAAVRGDPRSRRTAAESTVLDFHSQQIDDDLLTSRLGKRQVLPIADDPERARLRVNSEKEEESINGLWRVVSRSVQALSLIELLTRCQNDFRLPVKLDSLGQMNFRSFVISMTAHGKIKSIVNHMVMSGLHSLDKIVQDSVISVTQLLSKECFLYFSAGDIYSYEAAKVVEGIRKAQNEIAEGNFRASTKAEVEAATDKLVYLLVKASDYWRSLSSVRNSLDRVSELSSYCAMLAEIGDVGRAGIVRLCLTCATNFEAPTAIELSSGNRSTTLRKRESARLEASSNWERLLYHGCNALTEDEMRLAREACFQCLLCHIQRLLDVSDQVGNIRAIPAESTKNSKIPATENLLKSIRLMVNEALDNCLDQTFRFLLFGMLYDSAPDELIRIASRDVESFLLKNDHTAGYEVLCNYYQYHQLHCEAANQLYQLAHAEEPIVLLLDGPRNPGAVSNSAKKVSSTGGGNAEASAKACNHLLENRILLLQRSSTSALLASSEGEGSPIKLLGYDIHSTDGAEAEKNSSFMAFYNEIQEELVIAGFQKEMLDSLRAELSAVEKEKSSLIASQQQRRPQLNELEEQTIGLRTAVKRLERALLQISDLFNEIAVPFCLWPVAVCLIGFSGLNAHDAAKKLWRSIIFRRIPRNTVTPEGAVFVRDKTTDIFSDSRHQQRAGSFEDSDQWLADVENAFLSLGKRVLAYSGGPHHQTSMESSSQFNSGVLSSATSYAAFPASFLLAELEDIASTLSACGYPLGKGWAGRLFLQLGLAHSSIVALYMKMLEDATGWLPERIIQLVSSIVLIIFRWTEMVYNGSRSCESEKMQLVRSVRSGQLYAWLDRVQRAINTLGAAGSHRLSAHFNELLGNSTSSVAEIKRMVAEITMA